MKTAHTPGPWIVESGYEQTAPGIYIFAPKAGGRVIVSYDSEPTINDARLIAAAPELLEIALWVDKWLGDCAISGSVKAAIAKATGAK